MTEQRIDLEQAAMIFEQAGELDGEAREAYLDEACGGDAPLRAELHSMIDAHREQGEFLSEPTNEDAPSGTGTFDTEQLAERVGSKIGRYKLLQRIGEGGFGVVYMAEQQEPVRRKVAVKIIKLGMDTKQVIARFEAERQALAIMEHSNIARVLDAGATETGRPYFVMELVKGIPITDYCDQANLTTKERLDLFMPVCHAIQHAHQKGIIHRDVKPSNVMVTIRDGKPVPKVIDFGIAKATDHRLTEKTLFTEYHQFVGTPAYMSPEQAEMSELDIDTRTDVYSLGVLMYELLTGTTPFDLTALREAGYGEIQRIIREVDPPKPSTRLSTMDAHDLVLTAQRRQIEGTSLSKLVRGDLDCIVMRALEKDRTRRYETARELAMDVERHLANEPILASPPRVIYKLRKFVKRNRVAATAGLAVAVALVIGLMLSTVGFVQANRQREQAEAARNEAEQARTVEAEQRKVAVSERDQALQARQEARRQSYIANIIAAGAALSMNESRNVHRRLDAAPEEFRNWEWRYLDAQMDKSIAIFRLDGPVKSVVFRPDGTLMALGEDRTGVRLWDVSTGRELAVFHGHGRDDSSITSAFSPDRKLLALESNDYLARLFDVSTGKELVVFRGHKDVVNALGFSPDGTRLASGAGEDDTYDYDVRIWDVSSGEELAVLHGHEDHVNGVAFSPDGTRLATASCDDTVRLWDASTSKELAILRGHRNIVLRIAFSPDGAHIASASNDKTVRIWDASSGEELAILRGHNGPIESITFSPDGRSLASASADNTVRLWDVATGKELAKLLGHKGHVKGVAFSPDGSRLVSASSDRTVRVWDVSPNNVMPILRGFEGTVNSVAFSPDGNRIATGSNDRTLRIWDATTGEELATLSGHEGRVNRIAFSPDGTRLASPSSDKTVRLWDTATGRELAVLRGHNKGVGIVAFSPDGARLASTSLAEHVRVWDTSSGKELNALRGHEDTRGPVAFSPDGTRLASGSVDYSVRIWNASNGEELLTLPGHGSAIRGIAFSPDGTRLATSSGYAWGSGAKQADNTVRIWDSTTGQQLTVLLGHEDTPWWVTFSPDGSRLATASADKTVRIWDASTGEELAVLRGHEGTVYWVAFSSDGMRLASGGADKTVRIWDALPNRERYEKSQAIIAAGPEAQRTVEEIRHKLSDWSEVARHLRDDTSLSHPVRRAALNLVLRRATNHP